MLCLNPFLLFLINSEREWNVSFSLFYLPNPTRCLCLVGAQKDGFEKLETWTLLLWVTRNISMYGREKSTITALLKHRSASRQVTIGVLAWR